MRLEPINDADDPRLAPYRELTRPGKGRRQDVFVVEGGHAVRLLLRSRFRTRSLLLTEHAVEGMRDALEGLAPDVPVFVGSAAVLRAVTAFAFHGGHLALGERAPEPPLEALLAPPGPRLVVALERLANPDNVGGVLRNAAAFGAAAALLSPGCADPLYRRAIRVSVGAALHVPFATLADWPAGLRRLRAAGFTLVALTPRPDATDIARVSAERVAVLVGHETDGLAAGALAEADVAARIPMAPGADSLNAAAATAVALHRLTAWR